MTARVIAVAQQKGGAGKTTIAAQLAVSWTMRGRKVAMLDVDPQGSLKAWHALRRERGGPEGPHVVDVPGWKLGTEIDRLRAAFDILVIDSPPHAETDARIAVRAADLVIVPVQPSPMDLWATKATLDLARAERRPILLVLNRVPPRGRLLDAARADIAAQGLALAETSLGNRSVFAASMMEGQGAAEIQPRGTAAQELARLAAEIDARLGSNL